MIRRLRVVVDRDLCDAYGNCAARAPAVFAIDEDDQMKLLLEYPPEDGMDAVRSAVSGCPKGALSLVEE